VIRAVIDTNVVVSGLLSPEGKEALILLAINHGLIRPCFSDQILKEYADVLERPKFAFEPENIASVLTMFHACGEHAVSEQLNAYANVTLQDHGDTPFLQCALALRADCIVTGNKRHFSDEACAGIRIVNARELLDHIAGALTA
jgi:putative PIN family toxin of toxin-antitoxin system